MSEEKNSSELIAELKAQAGQEPIARFFNMRLVELTPGYSKIAMKLKPEYMNFNGVAFGAIIVAVADQAFAYATNSLIRPSLASQFNIHFLAPCGENDELIAECRVLRSGRRVAVSEMTVSNQDGKLIAKATGITIPVVK